MVKVAAHFFGDGKGQMQVGRIQQFLRNATHPFIGTHSAIGRTESGFAGEGHNPFFMTLRADIACIPQRVMYTTL